MNLERLHRALGARFTMVSGAEIVADYGDPLAEHAALWDSAGVIDLSFRSRIAVMGGDRQRFLNGQVTNNVKDLRPGQGCYAALITAKGKMQSDLNLYCLDDEFLLDFEPGLSQSVASRLEKYVIADDVTIHDVASRFVLFAVQGPRAGEVIAGLKLFDAVPREPLRFVKTFDPAFESALCANHPRGNASAFDLFIPAGVAESLADRLFAAVRAVGGRPCGWHAWEMARIEHGIPRFGVDMDESNLPPEAGLESRAISYTKGCYIGQEVISRLRAYGEVAKKLCGLRLPDGPISLPQKGDTLMHAGKVVGNLTSALVSPRFGANIALGYVRRECYAMGTELVVKTSAGELSARVVELPFA